VAIVEEKGGKPQTFFDKIANFFTMKGGDVVYSNLNISSETKMLLPRKINHPKYGFSYYFSNDILNEKDIDKIPRYVVFIEKCKYMIVPETETEKEEEDEEEDEETEKIEEDDFESLYFQNENGFPIWSVKSSRFFAKL